MSFVSCSLKVLWPDKFDVIIIYVNKVYIFIFLNNKLIKEIEHVIFKEKKKIT